MEATFSRLLAAEIAAVQRFVELLQAEQQVLKDGKVDELGAVTQAKRKLVEELNALGQQRHDFLAESGVSETRSDMESWLLRQQNPKLLQGWRALQQLAREAKSLNELNGQCIALLARNNRELMDAITGQHARGTFYGPDGGQTASRSGYRISDAV